MSLGEKIKALRKERGWTQCMLGKRINWADSRIGEYERGEKLPRHQSIVRLASTFGISVEELIQGTELEGKV